MLTCNEQEKNTNVFWDDSEWGTSQLDDSNPQVSEDSMTESWWSDEK